MSSGIRTTAVVVASTVLLAAAAGAQTEAAPPRADSAPHFSLFAGGFGSTGLNRQPGTELGGSRDFRTSAFPVPLRLSVAFSEQLDRDAFGPVRQGTASLELVMRPIPATLGLRPYFLGGMGVGTMAGYSGFRPVYGLDANGYSVTSYQPFVQPRVNWTFMSIGAGVDVGRAFVQVRRLIPVASNGPTITPVSVGFRFWD